jgi:uroporphyrinogen-III synthase
MKVLITRAEPGATKTATALHARGVETIVAPLLNIRDADAITESLSRVQALAFTSANGVRAWAKLREERHLTAWCVGDATRDAAHEAGFEKTRSAGGDAHALADLLIRGLEPERGAILHVRGGHTAGDLSGTLQRNGFPVHETIAYRAEVEQQLPSLAREALTSRMLSSVLFHSPRAAGAFTALVDDAGLNARLESVIAIAISPATASNLIGSDWAAIRIAETPDEGALLDRVGAGPDRP